MGQSTRILNDNFRTRINSADCIYCGELANTDEHFPPQSVTGTGFIFRACKECNNFAGTIWSDNFWERVNHVKAKINERYKKILNTPKWSQEEVDELEYNLKVEAIKWDEQREKTLHRIAFNVSEHLARIDLNNDFADFLVKTDSTIWRRLSSYRSAERQLRARRPKPKAIRVHKPKPEPPPPETPDQVIKALGILADLPLGKAVLRKFGSPNT